MIGFEPTFATPLTATDLEDQIGYIDILYCYLYRIIERMSSRILTITYKASLIEKYHWM